MHLARTIVVILTAGLAACCALQPVQAHDHWINRSGLRNAAGELCCHAGDCGVVDTNGVFVTPRGYELRGSVTYGEAATGNRADGPTHSEPLNEMIPFGQVMPSPDGAFWRCKRPDGSQRCFFAPPSGS